MFIYTLITRCFYQLTFKRFISTIYALSSGQGKCGVAVLRVSGPDSGTALQQLTRMKTLPEPRKAVLKYICDPKTNMKLDRGLVLWFPGPKSYTGEDSCELQVHGGVAIISSVLNALNSVDRLRLAEPGEFTKRAFHAGKLDLMEVEGITDLIHAETELQRQQAFLQSDGTVSKLYNEWRSGLIKCVANVEAYIDFDETETLEDGVLDDVAVRVETIRSNVRRHLNDSRKGEILRSGVQTVILGEPNVGKSSLLNALCNRPAAIVTPIAGTTRDIINVTLDIKGYPLVLADTAGLRLHTDDIVEKEGISRALQSTAAADLILFVVDSQRYIRSDCCQLSYDDLTNNYLTSLTDSDVVKSHMEKEKPFLVVFNKIDLLTAEETIRLKYLCDDKHRRCLMLSCKTNQHLSDVVKQLAMALETICGNPSHEHPTANQFRHRVHLTKCLESLQMFMRRLSIKRDRGCDAVLMAEDLRKALREIGKLTGNVTTEQILDVIFKDFCIGK